MHSQSAHQHRASPSGASAQAWLLPACKGVTEGSLIGFGHHNGRSQQSRAGAMTCLWRLC